MNILSTKGMVRACRVTKPSNIPAKIVKGTVLTNILKAFFAPYLKELNLE